MKKQNIIRLAALLLSVAMLLTAGATVSYADIEPSDAAAEPDANISVPAGMVVGLENEQFRVYVDSTTGRFGLENKADGTIWWSTPENAESDTIANGKTQMELQSNLIIRYADLDDEDQSMDTINSYAGAVRPGNVAVTVEKDRIRIAYKMTEYRLYVPIDLTLDEEGLTCSIAVDEILEGGQYRIYTLMLLPYFGAGNAADNGYMLVPDGSGAIIRFNNGKEKATQYSAVTYGRDYAVDTLNDSDSDEDIRMPLYGICKNNSSVLTVLEEGSALARIEANVGGLTSEYNQAYASFSMRAIDTYYIGQSLGNSSKVTLLDDGPFAMKRLSVKMIPVTDGDGYVGMAKAYRSHLLRQGMQKSNTYRQELHLQLLGSIRRTEHFIGIPYETTVTVTSTEEAKKILERLHADGVDNVAVRYLNWNKKAVTGKVNSKVSVIGGKKNWNSLMNTADEYGMTVYPDTEWNVVSSFSLRYSKWSASARTLGNKPISVYAFNFVNFFKDTLIKPRYLLAPSKVEKLAGEFLPRYGKLNTAKLGFSDLADNLSADYGVDGWTREESLRTMQRIAAAAHQDNGLLFAGGNAYTLPYAERVMDAPSTSSGYDVEDASVPFYEIALYGCIPTSGTAINLAQEDVAMPFLRALESGSSVSYIWTASDSKRLNDSNYESWYSTRYEVWYAQALEQAKVLCDFSTRVNGCDIARHEIISDNVRRTTWDNGVSVIVNYGSAPATVDGETVEPRGYLIKEGSL